MQYLQTPATLIAAPLNPLAVVDGLVYLFVHCLGRLRQFGMFFLGGLGFVLSGVLVVVGPVIFVLWMWGGVPGQWAWNWFNALIAVGLTVRWAKSCNTSCRKCGSILFRIRLQAIPPSRIGSRTAECAYVSRCFTCLP